jgi:hypothetical protein
MVRSAPKPVKIASGAPWRDQFEFDTSRFESSLPSQPPRSLAGDFGQSRKCRHFRGLADKSLVSGEKSRASRTKGREFRDESLLDEFSISEIWEQERPETGCVSAETGSNLPALLRRAGDRAAVRFAYGWHDDSGNWFRIKARPRRCPGATMLSP